MYMYSLLVTTTHLIMAAEERRVCVGERERERERERGVHVVVDKASELMYMYMYIYVPLNPLFQLACQERLHL